MSTLNYYSQNASAYLEDTQNVDMSALTQKFLSHLTPGGHILDAGCGSGRDAYHFKQLGYRVTALEPCEELACHTEQLLGQKVCRLTFQQMGWENQFDGIWACASLLHVPESELIDVFQRLQRALKRNGVFYFSFKYGTTERVKDGRLFADMDEARIELLLNQLPELQLIELWQTHDVRPNRASEPWLNGLVSKKSVK